MLLLPTRTMNFGKLADQIYCKSISNNIRFAMKKYLIFSKIKFWNLKC